jgi:hypothetical protein
MTTQSEDAPRISGPESMVLATLTDKYSQFTDGARQRLHQVMLIFKPDTVLRWYRVLVRGKWTFKRIGKPSRPGRSSELDALIVRLAKENPRWGCDKIQGELLKPGYNLSASSVRNTLKRHRLTPASERSSGSWRSFLEHDKDQILANGNHLRRVLREYGEYDNPARPHQGIGQRFPVSSPERSTIGPIRRRDVLGCVIHDYHRQPSAPVSGNG